MDGDFKRRKFGSILDVIPLCEDVIKIKAICKRCKKRDAIFTHRLTNEQKQTVVGADIEGLKHFFNESYKRVLS